MHADRGLSHRSRAMFSLDVMMTLMMFSIVFAMLLTNYLGGEGTGTKFYMMTKETSELINERAKHECFATFIEVKCSQGDVKGSDISEAAKNLCGLTSSEYDRLTKNPGELKTTMWGCETK